MALAKCGTAATSALPTFWSESNQPIMTCQRRASKSSPSDEDLGDCHMVMFLIIVGRRVQNSYLLVGLFYLCQKNVQRIYFISILFCTISFNFILYPRIHNASTHLPSKPKKKKQAIQYTVYSIQYTVYPEAPIKFQGYRPINNR